MSIISTFFWKSSVFSQRSPKTVNLYSSERSIWFFAYCKTYNILLGQLLFYLLLSTHRGLSHR